LKIFHCHFHQRTHRQDVTLHSGAKAMLLRTPTAQWLLAVLPADAKLSWKKLRAMHGKGTRIATEEAAGGCWEMLGVGGFRSRSQ
jgi:prolyl-tRNA editing enzyme YbaK/EbsC (Cys-tRNA(Pro) deacylase)